jgi:hypothetical protein
MAADPLVIMRAREESVRRRNFGTAFIQGELELGPVGPPVH